MKKHDEKKIINKHTTYFFWDMSLCMVFELCVSVVPKYNYISANILYASHTPKINFKKQIFAARKPIMIFKILT